jgi:quinol monooxygenase YgiN
MDRIHFTAKFLKIDPDDLDAFKKLAAELLEVTKAEPGNIQYDYFLSPDSTVCVVQESYADSDAVLAHMAGMSELLPRAIELGGGFEATCCGNPSPQLVEALAGLPIYSYFQGK